MSKLFLGFSPPDVEDPDVVVVADDSLFSQCDIFFFSSNQIIKIFLFFSSGKPLSHVVVFFVCKRNIIFVSFEKVFSNEKSKSLKIPRKTLEKRKPQKNRREEEKIINVIKNSFPFFRLKYNFFFVCC